MVAMEGRTQQMRVHRKGWAQLSTSDRLFNPHWPRAQPAAQQPCIVQRCLTCSKASRQQGDAQGTEDQGKGSSKRVLPARAKPGVAADELILEIPSKQQPARISHMERSSFRRKGLEGDALKQAKAEAKKELEEQLSKIEKWSQAMKNGKDTCDMEFRLPSIMLVDAYNVLYKDPHLTGLAAHDLRMARTELEDWLEKYSRSARIHCLSVWDAMYGKKKQNSHTRVSRWVTSVFTAQSEADSWIINKAVLAQNKGAFKVVVVSQDSRIHEALTDVEVTFLDVNMFVRHLKEVQQGNSAGPEAWRSLWQQPRLNPYRGSYQKQALFKSSQGEGPRSGDESGSDADDDTEGQTVVDELMGERLTQQLEGIVKHAQERQPWELSGGLYMQTLMAEGGQHGEGMPAGAQDMGDVVAQAKSDAGDEDDEELELDMLLKKKL